MKQMNNFEESIEDPCLRFLREESSSNRSELWGRQVQNQESPRIEEERNQYSMIEYAEEGLFPKKRGNKEYKQGKKKVFYREKMASLMTDEGKMKNEYHYAEFAHSNRGKTPISREEQLKRNRESAKQSRQRRKEYVETLQQKNNQNLKIISDLTMKLRQVQIERDRLREDNRSYIKSFLSCKNEAFQNLSETVKTENKEKIGIQYGAAGSERVTTTNSYIQEIIQILIGDLHKYLVYSAMNNSGLLGQGQWSRMDDNICQQLKIDKRNRSHLSTKFKDKMKTQFQSFKKIAHLFYETYQSVQNQAHVIGRVFTELSLEFQDDQIAKLLIWVEQNKFNKEMKKIRSFWLQSIIQFDEMKDEKTLKFPQSY